MWIDLVEPEMGSLLYIAARPSTDIRPSTDGPEHIHQIHAYYFRFLASSQLGNFTDIDCRALATNSVVHWNIFILKS